MHTLERKATSSNERDENQVDRPLFAVAGIRLIFIEIGASFEQDRISTRVGRVLLARASLCGRKPV